MNIITIDLETYYDREYSLSKMTTEAYVRDPRFEVIGMGIKVNDNPTVWCAGKNVAKVLKSIDFSDKAILAHNTAFDGAILSWHFGVKPKLWLDTLSMARPFHNSSVGGSLKALVEHYGLGAKGTEVVNALGKRREDFTAEELARYGEYCVNDVDLTRALFKKLAPKVPASELAIIDLTLRMYTEPMLEIDTDLLRQHLATVQTRKANLIASLGLGNEEKETKELLMSNPKFAEILRGFGVDPPTKVSARTGKEAWAFSKTDKDFLALLEHDDERVSTAVAARLGVKTTIEETRTQALLGVAERGRLPILLNYFGAHTGRFCLVGETEIVVYRRSTTLHIPLAQLLPDDLVWDGEEFVSHGGLLDQGEREVMTYNGITGTPDHRVFCDEVSGAVELREAAERKYTITVASPPE